MEWDIDGVKQWNWVMTEPGKVLYLYMIVHTLFLVPQLELTVTADKPHLIAKDALSIHSCWAQGKP